MTRKILVTGATDGIGRETAIQLALEGHELLVHGRSDKKLDDLLVEIESKAAARPRAYSADFSDLSDVRDMAQHILDEHEHLDIVINNAGVYRTEQALDESGIDIRFVVNSIAPYLLTGALLPILGAGSRIVNLASAAQAPLEIDALAGRLQVDDEFQSYAQSKTALMMWTRYLAEKTRDSGLHLVSVNPGSLLASKMVKEGFGTEGKDINIGVRILIEACFSARFGNCSGAYFDNDCGDFSSPHPDVLNLEKTEALISEMDALLDRL